MARMNVFVTGGTGYVGSEIVRSLLKQGHNVALLQRDHTARPTPHPVKVIQGDLFSPDSLREGLSHAEAVIHLVGIIREKPRQKITMQRIHIEGTKAIVEAAIAAHVPRFIHMSALGSRPDAVSAYHQSKWEAEEVVRHSGLAYTIFRPSVIYGDGGPGPEFLGQLRGLVRSGPITPMIGDGHFPLQPVSVQTVATAFVNALRTPDSIDKTYELGGANVVSYKEVLELIASHEGKSLRPIAVPVWLMKFMVKGLGRFTWFPLTLDQLTMLLEGNECTDKTSAAKELQLELERFQLTPTSS